MIRKYGGGNFVKQVTCYNLLVTIMFAQQSGRKSFWDVDVSSEPTLF
ncbi:MAG: DUF4372 domain-containing protein [Bacteroidales bacterium]|nr:DUF4372 domain-containing protein [Bacteroidales bacterium]